MNPIRGGAAAILAALLALLTGTRNAAADKGTPQPVPTPIGIGPLYHPGPSGPIAQNRSELQCRSSSTRYGVHLELFAHGRVILVPAGIGVGHRATARCSYPLRTHDPTGVIGVAGSRPYTLGQFFALWRQPLSPTRLLGFTAPATRPVRAYVNGVRWRGDLAAIPLRRHAEIVLELGPVIPPHPSYRFPPGL